MASKAEEILVLRDRNLSSLPARSMKQGLFGTTLEDALQSLLERHPGIIPGKQIDPSSEDPPRFALLRREAPIAGWSLDHLYVDQYGVLTLVETKLAANQESRRTVMGQVIEYAANAWENWKQGTLRQAATEYHSHKNQNLDEILRDTFGEDDLEAFWIQVEENLKSGRFRIIIAADEIRPEVRRMIEYLNQETQNLELFGLEITCYGNTDEELVLVPRLVGQTQASVDRRTPSDKGTRWPPKRVLEAIGSLEDKKLSQRLLMIAEMAIKRDWFKESIAKNAAFGLSGRRGSRLFTLFSGGGGYVALAEHYFGEDDLVGRQELLGALQALGIIEDDLELGAVRDGRYFKRLIAELDDDEFRAFVRLLENYCGAEPR